MPRDLIDDLDNEKIVAHELIHHWFGDLVTCESWANTAMNEAFANYSEYLWLEYKYGRDEADYHLMQQWNGYLFSAVTSVHPLIYFGYDDKEDMFDMHSYNKGGSIMHMLRTYLGDDAFYAGLKKYLEDNAYSAVEAHDLRLALEAVSGRDLNWFFNQWFFSEGHPSLNINYSYDELEKLITLEVEQTQTLEQTPRIFRIPAFVDIYMEDGQVAREEIELDKRKQKFFFMAEQEPALVNFDPDRALLCEIMDNKSEENYYFQFFNAPKFLDRFEALQFFDRSDSPLANEVLTSALEDPYWVIRRQGAESIEIPSEKASALLRDMVKNDPHSQVRLAAIYKLLEWEEEKIEELAKYVIDNDQAYPVIGAALEVIASMDKATAERYAKKLESSKNSQLLVALSEIYLDSENPSHLPFFEQKLEQVDGYEAFTFIENYGKLVYALGFEHAITSIDVFKSLALNMGQSPWKRFAAAKALDDLRSDYRRHAGTIKDATQKDKASKAIAKLTEVIETIKAAETHEDVKMYYGRF